MHQECLCSTRLSIRTAWVWNKKAKGIATTNDYVVNQMTIILTYNISRYSAVVIIFPSVCLSTYSCKVRAWPY